VAAEFLAVEVDVRLVIDRAEIQEIVLARLRVGVERLAQPDRALIQLQLFRLRIPVARNLQVGDWSKLYSTHSPLSFGLRSS